MNVVNAPHTGNHTVFLSGPPGSGKTTLAVERLRHLLAEGVPAEQILILVPQRTLATPYYRAIHDAAMPAGTVVDVATVGGLARRTIELFWPLVAEAAGMRVAQRPRFLTLETAQYYMDRLAGPFLDEGAFEGITISRPRLVSQIIDNLNKAAAVGFPATEIASRLGRAWSGESARLKVYEQVQALAVAFRNACLAQNLLDWSLQIEVFWHHLLPLPQLKRYLLSGYRHLIVDNVEEDIPATHDLLRIWLPLAESALVVYDTGGGYRVFLGADPESGLSLASVCREHVVLDESHVAPPEVLALGEHLVAPFSDVKEASRADGGGDGANPRDALVYDVERFHPEMLEWVADEISRLVHQEGYEPGDIAVLSPFVSDALRFAMTERLDAYGIAVRTHRPSRELREAPAARALLTLARLAHRAWQRPPPAVDVAHALGMAIADLDPVRARLLTDIVYRVDDGQPVLLPFHQIVPDMQERISYLLGARYDEMRRWMEESGAAAEMDPDLDHYLSRLFGEVLSQPGFGFHRNLDAGAVAAELIESVQKFRRAVGEAASREQQGAGGNARTTPDLSSHELPTVAATSDGEAPVDEVGLRDAETFVPVSEGRSLALEYVDMVERGVVAAQYLESWQIRPENAVLLVPAYTFLMMNDPVDVQFWLNAGDASWSQRLLQPLTHPYVLRRGWPEAAVWSDEDEIEVRHESITRIVRGLAHRTRKQIYLTFSELNERGYEQQGLLRQSLQRVLKGTPPLAPDVEAGP